MSNIPDQDDVEKIFATCRDQAVLLSGHAPWLLSSIKDRARLLVNEITALVQEGGKNNAVQISRTSQGTTPPTWRPFVYDTSYPPLHAIDATNLAAVTQERVRSLTRDTGAIEEDSDNEARESSRSAESTHAPLKRCEGHTMTGAASRSAEDESVVKPPSSTTGIETAHAADGTMDTVREESDSEGSVGDENERALPDLQADENISSLMEKHARESQSMHQLGGGTSENEAQELTPASVRGAAQSESHDPTRGESPNELSERDNDEAQDGMPELPALQAAAQTTQLQGAQEVGQVKARRAEAPDGLIRARLGKMPDETSGETPRAIREEITGDIPGDTGQEEGRRGEAREEEAQQHEAQVSVQETLRGGEVQEERQQGEVQTVQDDRQSQTCAPSSLGRMVELDNVTHKSMNENAKGSARHGKGNGTEDDTDDSSMPAGEEQPLQQPDAESSDGVTVMNRSHVAPDGEAPPSSKSRRGERLRSHKKDNPTNSDRMGTGCVPASHLQAVTAKNTGKRGANQPPHTPSKRQKHMEDPDTQLAGMEIRDLPKGLIRPIAASKLIAKLMDENDMRATSALTCLFFGIASPYALGQLRRACESVRNVQRPAVGSEESQVLESTRALDLMDAQEQTLPILRRYHLQHLLQYREERQKHHHSLLQNGKSGKRKHILRKRASSSVPAGAKIAAGAALKDMMRQAYPELQLVQSRNNPEYQRKLKALQNRLSAGRNWYMLQRKFGTGILALVPVGNGLTNADVEKTQHHIFDDFLNLLEQHRGGVLTTMSGNLSDNIFEVLLGKKRGPSFDLESVHQHELISRPYDSPALLRSCQRVQYRELSNEILSSDEVLSP